MTSRRTKSRIIKKSYMTNGCCTFGEKHCVIFVTTEVSRIKTGTNHNKDLHPRHDKWHKTVVLSVGASKRRAQCKQQHKLEKCQQWNTYSRDITYEGGSNCKHNVCSPCKTYASALDTFVWKCEEINKKTPNRHLEIHPHFPTPIKVCRSQLSKMPCSNTMPMEISGLLTFV